MSTTLREKVLRIIERYIVIQDGSHRDMIDPIIALITEERSAARKEFARMIKTISMIGSKRPPKVEDQKWTGFWVNIKAKDLDTLLAEYEDETTTK